VLTTTTTTTTIVGDLIEQIGTRPGGPCDTRPSTIITDYRLSQNEAFSLMNCNKCVELAVGHFGHGMTLLDTLLTKIWAKTILIFSFPVSDLDL